MHPGKVFNFFISVHCTNAKVLESKKTGEIKREKLKIFYPTSAKKSYYINRKG